MLPIIKKLNQDLDTEETKLYWLQEVNRIDEWWSTTALRIGNYLYNWVGCLNGDLSKCAKYVAYNALIDTSVVCLINKPSSIEDKISEVYEKTKNLLWNRAIEYSFSEIGSWFFTKIFGTTVPPALIAPLALPLTLGTPAGAGN